jgi:hypothetical protein
MRRFWVIEHFFLYVESSDSEKTRATRYSKYMDSSYIKAPDTPRIRKIKRGKGKTYSDQAAKTLK